MPAAGVVGILRRMERAVRGRWPGLAIEIRADSGFARRCPASVSGPS